MPPGLIAICEKRPPASRQPHALAPLAKDGAVQVLMPRASRLQASLPVRGSGIRPWSGIGIWSGIAGDRSALRQLGMASRPRGSQPGDRNLLGIATLVGNTASSLSSLNLQASTLVGDRRGLLPHARGHNSAIHATLPAPWGRGKTGGVSDSRARPLTPASLARVAVPAYAWPLPRPGADGRGRKGGRGRGWPDEQARRRGGLYHCAGGRSRRR